jgi:predicted Zn-dependent protease
VIDNMLIVKSQIEAVSGVKADLAVVETTYPNAFATHLQGRPVIALSTAYLDHLGRDRDALATTIGHELAHLHLGHSGQARREREETAKGVSNVVGTAVGLFIPFGGTLTNVAVTAVARSFTRDEEKAADEHGLKWAVAAGYDPCGKARTIAVFSRFHSQGVPILSTHPSYGERSELANEYSMKARSRPCQ